MPRSVHSGRPSTAILAGRIRAERERLGLSVAEAAERLGVSRQTWYQMEAASNLPYATLVGLIDDVGMVPEAICPELFDADAG